MIQIPQWGYEANKDEDYHNHADYDYIDDDDDDCNNNDGMMLLTTT